MTDGVDKARIASWHRHMARCMATVLAPIGAPDAKVTIIVRVPEALPHEAMISGNDDLRLVRGAVSYAIDGGRATEASGWQDMSTAPRETYVLVTLPDDQVMEAILLPWLGGWFWEARGHHVTPRPTHWRPMPAPPRGGA